MENKPSHAKQALPSEQAATKAAILAECERLAEAGITFVAVHFDGSGDEGANEEIKCYATEDYAYEESEAQETNFSCLQEHFEELDPYGYEQRMWRLRRRDLEREDPQDHGRKKRSLRRLHNLELRGLTWHTHLNMRKAAREVLAARPRTICGSTAWFDESKAFLPDFRHRALRHHAEGIFSCERLFGVAITNSEGRQIPVRYIGEQHVREDFGRIPTAQDWFSQIKPERWMYGQRLA